MKMKIRLKLKNISHRYDMNRGQPRNGHKYTKYKISHYYDGYVH